MLHISLYWCCVSAGVRLYFSTTPFAPPHQKNIAVRPSLLALVHVRLPPGFSASSTLQKPSKVHKALHSKGNKADGTQKRNLLVLHSATWCFTSYRCSSYGGFWDRGQWHSVVHQSWLVSLQEALNGDTGLHTRIIQYINISFAFLWDMHLFLLTCFKLLISISVLFAGPHLFICSTVDDV